MKEKSLYLLNLYLKSKQYSKELEYINEVFKETDINLEEFEKICLAQLDEIEKEVLVQYHVQQKSLKKIAAENDYSYAYMRKIYITAKEKARIILSVVLYNGENQDES